MSELAVAVAREIADAFKGRRPHYRKDERGEERPVSHTIESPSLAGKSYSELNSGGRSFDHDVSYNDDVALRKGKGIIASLELANGAYTGTVHAQAAMDDYDW
jgi:hypothetical protein